MDAKAVRTGRVEIFFVLLAAVVQGLRHFPSVNRRMKDALC